MNDLTIRKNHFLNNSNKIHKNKYDYLKSNYINNSTKIEIICPFHGSFFQVPYNHLLGRGCNKCAIENKKQQNTKTTKQFIIDARNIHGNKYDYSLVEYKRWNIFVKIICKKGHCFFQTPNSHLNGNGCSICSGNIKSNTEEFIKKAKKIHGNKYGYQFICYKNNRKKLKIVCFKHGIFYQSAHDHLRGNGCIKCGINIIINKLSLSRKEFINKSRKIHGNKYDYTKVNYINYSSNIEIICKNHGSFFQTPNNHLQGKGCIKCTWLISKPEKEFLNLLNIPLRNIRLKEWRSKSVDGYDPKTNTVYEFLGDYWHGNPNIFSPNKINKDTKKSFGELYRDTILKLEKLKSMGYNVKYIWENDWKKFKKRVDIQPNIITV